MLGTLAGLSEDGNWPEKLFGYVKLNIFDPPLWVWGVAKMYEVVLLV